MARVRLLDKALYELIAAGEVIERPSSIIKELVENSIDSGATAVTVEIKRGGISYMRVTDNGSGIYPEDAPTAFLRHATSKISSKEDLTGICTLGFRGEALASVAAVAKVDMLTKVKGAEYGTHYVIEGTEEKLNESCGCPDGTTIVVRDIFYNVPARLKFLKKDVAEGNDVSRIMEKIALSHPEISVKLIRDNKQTLFTPGDGKLYSAVYSVFGRQFASSLIPVDYSMNGIKVTGFTVKPIFGQKNRKLQTFFVNGRYVQSVTCIRALEEAYKNSIMEGKFPACVLCLTVRPDTLDVNVHPQKIEVRFTEEKLVYETMYFAVKNAVLSDSAPAEMELPKPKINYNAPVFGDKNTYEQTQINSGSVKIRASEAVRKENTAFEHISAADYNKNAPKAPERVTPDEYKKLAAKAEKPSPADTQRNGYVELPWEKLAPKKNVPAEPVRLKDNTPAIQPQKKKSDDKEADKVKNIPEEGIPIEKLVPNEEISEFKYINQQSFQPRAEETVTEENIPQEPPAYKRTPVYRLIGEAFRTYIVAEMDDDIIFVDKHAAHERMNFEKFRSGEVKLSCQLLLAPVDVRLTYSQYDAVCEHIGQVRELGFDIETGNTPVIRVKGIPSVLDMCDAEDIAYELAKNLDENRHDPMPEILDDMLHTIACKASVRANDINSEKELKVILDRIFSDEKIRYCPHGRPVMFRLTKKELEKQFKRIV